MHILFAVLAGTTIVTSRNVNAMLAKKIGAYESTFFNYLVGILLSIVVFFFSREAFVPFFAPESFSDVIMYLGGILGVVAIVISNFITPNISAFLLTLLIFISQLVTGIVVDFFLYHEFSIPKVAGGLLVLIGLVYNLYLDKKDEPKSAK
ncbi:MAG: DMT family transporter [Lachnospiraceae bacterium]|nr:DMT family transporter [Lachnospiraceae bacterium]